MIGRNFLTFVSERKNEATVDGGTADSAFFGEEAVGGRAKNGPVKKSFCVLNSVEYP